MFEKLTLSVAFLNLTPAPPPFSETRQSSRQGRPATIQPACHGAEKCVMHDSPRAREASGNARTLPLLCNLGRYANWNT
jgi:hypothetical protein